MISDSIVIKDIISISIYDKQGQLINTFNAKDWCIEVNNNNIGGNENGNIDEVD